MDAYYLPLFSIAFCMSERHIISSQVMERGMARQQLARAPSPLRRRRQDQAPRERTSIKLRSDVLEAAKHIVQAGHAQNLSAFVESAVEEKVRRTKRAALYASYVEAASDPDFQQRMNSVTRDFSNTETDAM